VIFIIPRIDSPNFTATYLPKYSGGAGLSFTECAEKPPASAVGMKSAVSLSLYNY
jgi:hypothetical protein